MKTIYYTDELNDDFAATNGIKTQALPPDYKWIHTGFLWNFFADILYYLIVFPLVKIFNTIVVGLHVKNRGVIRRLKSGYFLYSNHTMHIDPLLSADVSGWDTVLILWLGMTPFPLKGFTI